MLPNPIVDSLFPILYTSILLHHIIHTQFYALLFSPHTPPSSFEMDKLSEHTCKKKNLNLIP
ncbi:hypothetical protein BDZ91DRAFT_745347 [Kalaharituber pfeilii]|nr:hypothetical protein BDZ91DRAFT_745347 [Kalaharituber pfeilii]